MKEKKRDHTSDFDKPRYQKCYVALTLDSQFLPDFENLLKEVRILDPNLRTVDPKRPHITLLRMGNLSESQKPLAEKIIEVGVSGLWGRKIRAGGMGVFKDDISGTPDILYLKVRCRKLNEASNILKENLSSFVNRKEYFPYVPHITLAHILNKKSYQETFESASKELKEALSTVKWNYKIEEVVLFGRDAKKVPSHPEPVTVFNKRSETSFTVQDIQEPAWGWSIL